MDFDLTSEQELIRDTVRTFARERVEPVAAELDLNGRFPYDLVTELGELGLMGLPIPAAFGGAGGDTVSYAIAIEELTRIDSSVAITVAAHTSLGTMPILIYGSDEQKERWLPELASGKKLAAFGLTEPDAGSDAGATRTTAELRDGSWVVSGSKIFITNAGTDITWGVTITARTGEDEISNIVVENGTPGYTVSAPMQKLGWRASDTRELSFDECSVPEGNLLGPRGEGFRQFLEILDGGRISVAAMGVGLAQGAYDLAYAYAQEREQFGKPISSFQAIRFKLADMATEIEAGRALVYKAAWLKDQGRPFALEAAMAKLFTGELSNRWRTPPSRSTAGSATWRRRPSRACTATRRSLRSARARTRCSGWSSLAISACSGVAALVLAGPAAAHVVAMPTYVASKGSESILLAVPNEREKPMTSFVVKAPSGLGSRTCTRSPGGTSRRRVRPPQPGAGDRYLRGRKWASG